MMKKGGIRYNVLIIILLLIFIHISSMEKGRPIAQQAKGILSKENRNKIINIFTGQHDNLLEFQISALK